jgi:hypothetical protein
MTDPQMAAGKYKKKGTVLFSNQKKRTVPFSFYGQGASSPRGLKSAGRTFLSIK